MEATTTAKKSGWFQSVRANQNVKIVTGTVAAISALSGITQIGTYAHLLLSWVDHRFDFVGAWLESFLHIPAPFGKYTLLTVAILPFILTGIGDKSADRMNEKNDVKRDIILILTTWVVYCTFLFKNIVLINSVFDTTEEIYLIAMSLSITLIMFVISIIIYILLISSIKIGNYKRYILSISTPTLALVVGLLLIYYHEYSLPIQLDLVTSTYLFFILLPAFMVVNPDRVRFMDMTILGIVAASYGVDLLVAIGHHL